MLNAINSFLGNNNSELIETLKESGFSQEQATQFLPEAGGNIMELIKGGDIDASSILQSINVTSLAEKVGVNESLVTSGLTTLIPSLQSKLSNGGISGILGKVRSLVN